jgi:hypothetical protein
MKKAYELSILCDVQIGLIMFTPEDKLYMYSSEMMNDIIVKYTEFTENEEPTESFMNNDMDELILFGKKDDLDGADDEDEDDSEEVFV